MRNGTTLSCGCYRKERCKEALAVKKKNGGSRIADVRYKRYYAMLQRCSDRAVGKGKKNYSEQGIEVCESWKQSYDNFCHDMGDCPEGLELDRIDNSKGYAPDNCRWVDRRTNQFNKSLSERNTSGRTGISWHVNKWRVYITVQGSQINLGRYADYEEAVNARKLGELKYYGFSLQQ